MTRGTAMIVKTKVLFKLRTIPVKWYRLVIKIKDSC